MAKNIKLMKTTKDDVSEVVSSVRWQVCRVNRSIGEERERFVKLLSLSLNRALTDLSMILMDDPDADGMKKCNNIMKRFMSIHELMEKGSVEDGVAELNKIFMLVWYKW